MKFGLLNYTIRAADYPPEKTISRDLGNGPGGQGRRIRPVRRQPHLPDLPRPQVPSVALGCRPGTRDRRYVPPHGDLPPGPAKSGGRGRPGGNPGRNHRGPVHPGSGRGTPQPALRRVQRRAPEHRGSRTGESLQVIKRLWTEDEVTYQGKHFSLSGARTAIKPVQKPHLPIWVAGNASRAIRRAARWGDSWYPTTSDSLEELESGRDYYYQCLEGFRPDRARPASGAPRPVHRRRLRDGPAGRSAAHTQRSEALGRRGIQPGPLFRRLSRSRWLRT